MSKAKVATVWLDGCSGCHMSLLDMDETIAAVAAKADIVYGPLVDAQEFPEGVDVTLVEGSVSSEDDLEKIRLARNRSRVLVALGDCAVTSNVPAMRNPVGVKPILERVYAGKPPVSGVPPLLAHTVPLRQVVKVDLHVPGCPPPPAAIAYVLGELLEGRLPDLNGKVKFG
jgi:NAD-reducing hydrogenase small subunit